MANPNPVFVRVDSPLEVKKSVIETAISSVLLINDLERKRLLDKQGGEIASRFILVIRNIERQVDALSRLLPHISDAAKSSPQPYMESNQYTDEEYSVPRVYGLEDELRNIESKLKNISF